MAEDCIKQREEEKRARVLAQDPAERWRQIQRMITWAEQNMPEHLRRNRPRVHKSMLPDHSDQ